MSDAESQSVAFFIKRADYAAGLAATHFKGMEYEKAMNLYKEAYTFYKKAEVTLPNDAGLKQKIDQAKIKYQECKKKCEEKKAP